MDFLFIPFYQCYFLFLLGIFPSILMIGLLMLSYFLISPLKTLNDAKIQHCIKSKNRATIISVDSLFVNLFSIFIILGAGIISEIWNLLTIYIATGIFLFIFSLWVLVNKKYVNS